MAAWYYFQTAQIAERIQLAAKFVPRTCNIQVFFFNNTDG